MAFTSYDIAMLARWQQNHMKTCAHHMGVGMQDLPDSPCLRSCSRRQALDPPGCPVRRRWWAGGSGPGARSALSAHARATWCRVTGQGFLTDPQCSGPIPLPGRSKASSELLVVFSRKAFSNGSSWRERWILGSSKDWGFHEEETVLGWFGFKRGREGGKKMRISLRGSGIFISSYASSV